jgi:integrase
MALRFDRLDRAAIRRLQSGQKIMEHGITAERLADGDVRYSVNIMVDGERIHRVVGRESEGVTRTQCEQFIETQRSAAREDRLSLPAGRKTHLTFRQAAAKYLALMEETDGKNLDRKRLHLNDRLVPFFGDRPLRKISDFAVKGYKKRRASEGAAVGSINRELATLSHLLSIAVHKDNAWIKIGERPEIERDEEPPTSRRALSDTDCHRLLHAAVQDSDTRAYLFVAFGLNTAMRHSEILAARFDQINWDTLRLHIPQAKAGQREQPITQELAGMLAREREMADDPMGWIFPDTRKNAKGHRRSMRRAFRRAVVAAGLDPKLVTPHTMRHTAITKLAMANVDNFTIQRISGHKTLAMVERYTHVLDEHVNRATGKLGLGVTVGLRVIK